MIDQPDFNDEGIEDKLETLLDDENEIKNWNEGLLIKSLILIPIIIFAFGWFIVNRPESLIELLFELLYPITLIFIGLIIMFIMRDNLR